MGWSSVLNNKENLQESQADNAIPNSGGVRGIVELEILSLVQKLLDPIPLRMFFDLVVGTRSATDSIRP